MDVSGEPASSNVSSFFYWRYNLMWVLAFLVILFHSFLYLHIFLHLLIPIFFGSSSKSSIHLFLGLPLIFLLIGFQSNTPSGVFFSSIRITWPSQTILLLFINIAMSGLLLVRSVRGSFWFSRIHLHFALDQKFSLIFPPASLQMNNNRDSLHTRVIYHRVIWQKTYIFDHIIIYLLYILSQYNLFIIYFITI